jgi:predicted transcriptional regulator
MAAASDERAETLRDFRSAVNMTPAALEKWLATGESRAVRITHGEGTESVGHHSGRRIVDLLRKADAELGGDDLAHMRKVVGYVHRHLAQRPAGDVRHTRWSQMNWGLDPLEP